jgi:hypothetical protein
MSASMNILGQDNKKRRERVSIFHGRRWEMPYGHELFSCDIDRDGRGVVLEERN